MDPQQKQTMLDYIASCPQFMRDNVARSAELTRPLVEEFLSERYKNIWIIASGSSANGALCARQFVRRCLGCEVKLVTPFQFISSEHDFTSSDMLIVVSQSGYSLNVLNAVRLIHQQGRRCIGLTGDLSSELAKDCDIAVNYGVGRETVGYVTRGVTTLALFFMLFAIEAAEKLGRKTAEEAAELRRQLVDAADCNDTMRQAAQQFLQQHYQGISGMTNAYVCGVGANFGTASEGALKFGETISIPTAAYEAEEYIHGPNIQMTPRYTVFLIDGGEGRSRIHQIYEGTRIVTPNAYLLTTDPMYTGDNVLTLPCGLPDEITPLCFLPFFQVLAYQLADDLNRWFKHPLQRKMNKACSAKSEGYVNSPFSEDTPGRTD